MTAEQAGDDAPAKKTSKSDDIYEGEQIGLSPFYRGRKKSKRTGADFGPVIYRHYPDGEMKDVLRGNVEVLFASEPENTARPTTQSSWRIRRTRFECGREDVETFELTTSNFQGPGVARLSEALARMGFSGTAAAAQGIRLLLEALADADGIRPVTSYERFGWHRHRSGGLLHVLDGATRSARGVVVDTSDKAVSCIAPSVDDNLRRSFRRTPDLAPVWDDAPYDVLLRGTGCGNEHVDVALMGAVFRVMHPHPATDDRPPGAFPFIIDVSGVPGIGKTTRINAHAGIAGDLTQNAASALNEGSTIIGASRSMGAVSSAMLPAMDRKADEGKARKGGLSFVQLIKTVFDRTTGSKGSYGSAGTYRDAIPGGALVSTGELDPYVMLRQLGDAAASDGTRQRFLSLRMSADVARSGDTRDRVRELFKRPLRRAMRDNGEAFIAWCLARDVAGHTEEDARNAADAADAVIRGFAWPDGWEPPHRQLDDVAAHVLTGLFLLRQFLVEIAPASFLIGWLDDAVPLFLTHFAERDRFRAEGLEEAEAATFSDDLLGAIREEMLACRAHVELDKAMLPDLAGRIGCSEPEARRHLGYGAAKLAPQSQAIGSYVLHGTHGPCVAVRPGQMDVLAGMLLSRISERGGTSRTRDDVRSTLAACAVGGEGRNKATKIRYRGEFQRFYLIPLHHLVLHFTAADYDDTLPADAPGAPLGENVVPFPVPTTPDVTRTMADDFDGFDKEDAHGDD